MVRNYRRQAALVFAICLVAISPVADAGAAYFHLHSIFNSRDGADAARGALTQWAYFDGPAASMPEPILIFLVGIGLMAAAAGLRRGEDGQA